MYFVIFQNSNQWILIFVIKNKCGLSWPRSYGISPLILWVQISIRARYTTLCDTVRQWLATGLWFSLSSRISSTNKTDRHDITEILLKVVLNTIKQTTKTVIKMMYWVSPYMVQPIHKDKWEYMPSQATICENGIFFINDFISTANNLVCIYWSLILCINFKWFA
jgi:hypothetical protein